MTNILMQPGIYFPVTILLGLAGGWLFYLIWRALLPRGYSRELLASMPAQVRGMLASEETADLFRHYRTLLSALGRYAARNLLAVVVAVLPATALYFLFVELNPLNPPATASLHRNPLAPFLDDVEFVFFVAVTVGSIVGALAGRARRGGRA